MEQSISQTCQEQLNSTLMIMPADKASTTTPWNKTDPYAQPSKVYQRTSARSNPEPKHLTPKEDTKIKLKVFRNNNFVLTVMLVVS